MKLITIQVEDSEHQRIKLEATKQGLSMKDYLLGAAPKMQRNARQATPQEREVLGTDTIELPRTPITKPRKLCKHGFSKGECVHKESLRLKCNV
jgi:hypothetical protein